ncbi:hypothetical protein FGO68_gene11180 [Halteria grandinella]|uniref:Palmitoyltransferase n=1 Tax=Halteria grandinella TaxID=5974 RepID=A0A8J8NRA2_HALGN|nr:hypothetical protein FGO68_gene11180 [Halteria grandinella]
MQFEETSTASSSNSTPAVRQTIKKPSWDDVETSIDRQFPPQVRNHIRFRYCNKCRQVKPPRTHHCSICDACVRKMDHHCPWVGNCVGLYNHKFFWLFLLYAFIGCLHCSLSLFLGSDFRKMVSSIPYLLACVMSFAFGISILALLCVHTYLIANNSTTIESGSLSDCNPFLLHTQSDTGCFQKSLKNAETTFGVGEPWWRWLMPVEPLERGYQGVDVQLRRKKRIALRRPQRDAEDEV